MSKYFYLNDFAKISGHGNRRKASCPECGSDDNVSLDFEKGLVHCFTPGCECKGCLIDRDRPVGADGEPLPLGTALPIDIAHWRTNHGYTAEPPQNKHYTKGVGPDHEPASSSYGDSALSHEEASSSYGDSALGHEEASSAYSDSASAYGPSSEPFGPKPDNSPESPPSATPSPASLVVSRYPKDASVVPIFPSDFKGVKPELISRLRTISWDETERDECILAVRQYLTQICISPDTVSHFGLKAYIFDYADADTGRKTTEGRSPHYSLCYPTWLLGQCVNLKTRAVDVKAFRNEKANKQLPGVPYNIAAFDPSASDRPSELILVEGERDVLSLYEAGYAGGVSVANGGGEDVRRTLAPFRAWTDMVDEVVICGDSDYAGRLLQMRLLDLFRDRARLAQLPPGCKDISDVLLRQGKEGVRRVIGSAQRLTPKNLIAPRSVRSQIIDNLQGKFDHGYSCGYGQAFDLHLRFSLRGGLCVLTGYPGDGKSDFLYDLAAHLMYYQQKRFTFVSLEQPDNADAMAGVIRRLVGRFDMSVFTEEELNAYIERLDPLMNCFDIEGGDPSVYDITDACTRNLRQFHPDFLVVDNYARLRRDNIDDQNETEFIRTLLVALQDWGLRHHIWVIVVAHPRKPQDSQSAHQADAASVSGSAHWNNLADLGLTVRRELRDDGTDYKELYVWKVRDQRLCLPGFIYLIRQPCGRYEVRSSKEEVEHECLSGVSYRDTGSWID